MKPGTLPSAMVAIYRMCRVMVLVAATIPILAPRVAERIATVARVMGVGEDQVRALVPPPCLALLPIPILTPPVVVTPPFVTPPILTPPILTPPEVGR